MPNIREYSSPSDLGLQPSDRGTEAAANSGRRISGLYNEAGEAANDTGRRIASTIQDVGDVVVKYEDHREISAGAAHGAQLASNLDQAWNKTISKADPNDPSVAAKFRAEVLEPALEDFKSTFNTENSQKWAEQFIDSQRTHLFEKSTADMSRLAGSAVRQNIETLTNQLSNAAVTDPTSLKMSLGMVEHSIGAMVDSSPNLGGIDGAIIKTELIASSQAAIAKAAAIGALAKNPTAALKQFSSPEYAKFFSGADLKMLEQQAKTVQRAERVDQSYQRTMQKQAQTDASDQREGEYLAKLHSDDPQAASSVSAKAISNDFTLTREARERMIGIVERETKPEAAATVSNATASNLISRLRLPDGDPQRVSDLGPVYDAYEKGQLNKSDFKFVRDEFANIRTPEGEALGRRQKEFIDGVKPYIVTSGPMSSLDPSQSEQLYRFTLDLQKRVADYRRAGKDPRDLMDPSKPDYMGGPAALVPYQKPMSQVLAEKAASMKRMSGGFPAQSTITGTAIETAPAAPRNDAMPAIPPPNQRSPGLYETPKGQMQWTGTGWVKP